MLPDDETARLAALEAFGILDTAPDLSFDQLVNLVQELFKAVRGLMRSVP